jgi:hypothetical protein
MCVYYVYDMYADLRSQQSVKALRKDEEEIIKLLTRSKVLCVLTARTFEGSNDILLCMYNTIVS